MLIQLQQLLNDPQLSYIETLQQLWSGYGEIARYHSPKLNTSLIVKSVTPPAQINHPRGWHSETGHQRKLRSYQVEAAFYQHYAAQCNKACYVPKLIALQRTQQSSVQQILVMQDLLSLGFSDSKDSLSIHDINTVIHWLAHFHAQFLNYSADDLWPIGSYWHLATRQDEYNKMQSGPLKEAAAVIDQQLNQAQFQTLIHGDAKLANFCFGKFTSQNGQQRIEKHVAAVDFQYVGKGVGVKDLAYFLGSCLTDYELDTLHDQLLTEYFNELKQACHQYQKSLDFTALEKEWRYLYALANADFHRFLQGWSPGHYKINGYLQKQTDIAINEFN